MPGEILDFSPLTYCLPGSSVRLRRDFMNEGNLPEKEFVWVMAVSSLFKNVMSVFVKRQFPFLIMSHS